VFLRLAARADVVITNFKPGTMDEWGLGYDDVAARNPRLVYAAGSTFGERSADPSREGADLSGQAAGGLLGTIGVDGGEPSPVGATLADHIASLDLAAGVLAALLARERTGRGQRIDTSLIGGQLWAQASEYTAYLLRGRPAGRANRGNPLIPGLYGIFPTADGWIALVGVVGRARATFFETIGRPDLSTRFPQLLYWDAEKAELFPILDEAFRTRTTAQWSEVLAHAGLRFAPVRDHAEVVADPDVWANGYLAEITDDDDPERTARVVAAPVRFSDTPAKPAARAPELGEHTELVLLELGYSWDDISALRADGAV
jgi:crotonobetainyl-CoA:carnitine CoA-transferase CaiB-like acyl-CoA transferase